jgi:hypothetical protein
MLCNPAYMAWMMRDQAILGYLLSLLTRETLMHVSQCMMLVQAWRTLTDLYSSQSCARAVNMRIALMTMRKLQLSVSDYYSKMSQYADELATIGAPLCEDEFVAYLLACLNEDYNPVFTAKITRPDPISPSELFTQLLIFEQHTSLQAHNSSGASSSAMTTSHGHGFSSGHGYGSVDRGHEHGCGHGRGRSSCGTSNNGSKTPCSSTNSQPQCQVCLIIGHTTNRCWHHFEEDYVSEQHIVAAASHPGVDHSWYTDLGAMDHIIGDLDKLTMHEPYTGNDQIHASNGSGMGITRVVSSIIPTTSHPLALNNVLHVPTTSKKYFSP